MTLSTQISSDMAGVFFTAGGLADAVTLNSATVYCHVLEQGTEDRAGGPVAFIEAEFRLADYSSVDYADDSLVFAGVTWRNAVQVRADNFTRVVRFTSNHRPRAKR